MSSKPAAKSTPVKGKPARKDESSEDSSSSASSSEEEVAAKAAAKKPAAKAAPANKKTAARSSSSSSASDSDSEEESKKKKKPAAAKKPAAPAKKKAAASSSDSDSGSDSDDDKKKSAAKKPAPAKKPAAAAKKPVNAFAGLSDEEGSESASDSASDDEDSKPASKGKSKPAAAAAAAAAPAGGKGKKAAAAPAAAKGGEDDLDAILQDLSLKPAAGAAPTDESKMTKAQLKRLRQKQKAEAEKNAPPEAAAAAAAAPAPAAEDKKKPAAKEEKPKAGAKANKAVEALKERLRQQKEEEERRQREEEERVAALERERLRLEEEERLAAEEKERKAKARQEKREADRKAGLLLSKTERAAQAKRQAYLKQLEASGAPLPVALQGDKKADGDEAEAADGAAAAATPKERKKDQLKKKSAYGKRLEAQKEAERIRAERYAAEDSSRKEAKEEEERRKAEDAALAAKSAAAIAALDEEERALDVESPAEVESEEEEEVADSWEELDSEEERRKATAKEERRAARFAAKQERAAAKAAALANVAKKRADLAKAAEAEAAELKKRRQLIDEQRKKKAEEAAKAQQEQDRKAQAVAAGFEQETEQKPSDSGAASASGSSKADKRRGGGDLRSPIACILGHVDTGKCWGRGTKLMLYDGRTKRVEDIKAGDQLMGDDGTPRTVQMGSVSTGHTATDALTDAEAGTYRIASQDSGRDSWTCNADHILVLSFQSPPTEVYERVSRDQSRWHFSALEARKRGHIVVRQEYSYNTKTEADVARADYMRGWQPWIWECTVKQFIKCDKDVQAEAHMFQPEAVRFGAAGPCLRQRLSAAMGGVMATKEQALETAWVVGTWVTDGAANAPYIYQTMNNHTAVVERLERWHESVTGSRAVGIRRAATTNSTGDMVWRLDMGDVLRSVLHSYHLLDGERFPHEMLAETAQIRLQLLAGMIDGAGSYNACDRSFQVSAKKRSVIDGVISLARSLGFWAGKCIPAVALNDDTEEVFQGWRVNISGDIHRVPTELPYKRASMCPNMTAQCDPLSAAFTVMRVPHAPYFGFTVDGNGRFLMGDFIITHNTKILDKIRSTSVQAHEAGGITQQIGATFMPRANIMEKTAELAKFLGKELRMETPGLLVIDTPGHESFTNLRSRGSNLCDIAILVVDIMHGLEPQTIESINLLKQRKTPFVIALNKIDRCYGWKSIPNAPFQVSFNAQSDSTKDEFQKRTSEAMVLLAEQGLNVVEYYKNTDFRKWISIVPTSAITGEGIPDLLMLLTQLTQKMMEERLSYLSELQCTVLEVKVVEGLGTTIDVILVNGVLQEGDTIVVCGLTGPIVTTIRALLTPPPMHEIRVKSEYVHHKMVKAAMGVKISAQGLENAIAGSSLMVCKKNDDVEALKDEVQGDLATILSKVDRSGQGVAVQASTLGSLEALLAFLGDMKIPVASIGIGPVYKKDVIKAAVMLEKRPEFGVMLCFDVKVSADAQKIADEMGVKIFTADIIYHLFDACTKYMNEVRERKRGESADVAVFPCVLDILPSAVFNVKSPIVVGVRVVDGVARVGTPLCIPSKNFLVIGRITGIQKNHVDYQEAKKGEEFACKIEQSKSDQQIVFGRHFDASSQLVSKLTRESINLLKENFKDDLSEPEWKLVIKLKKVFEIV